MMNQNEVEDPSFPELKVTEEIRSHLYEMTKWAHFLAIVGFVITSFVVLIALGVGAAVKTNPQFAVMLGPLASFGSGGLTAIFLCYAFMIFYPSMLLFRYANQAKLGVLYGQQEALEQALARLKSLFKYYGIVAIIFIALNILSVLGTVFGKVA